jgi:hypothetical protein
MEVEMSHTAMPLQTRPVQRAALRMLALLAELAFAVKRRPDRSAIADEEIPSREDKVGSIRSDPSYPPRVSRFEDYENSTLVAKHSPEALQFSLTRSIER